MFGVKTACADVQYPPFYGMWNFHTLYLSYDGLQYHVSMALVTHLILVSIWLKIVVRHTGREKETRLKSCGTSKTWYADSWGWEQDFRSIFNVSCACLINVHHSTEGKISPHVLRPVIV